jgi:hypothetical protein
VVSLCRESADDDTGASEDQRRDREQTGGRQFEPGYRVKVSDGSRSDRLMDGDEESPDSRGGCRERSAADEKPHNDDGDDPGSDPTPDATDQQRRRHVLALHTYGDDRASKVPSGWQSPDQAENL